MCCLAEYFYKFLTTAEKFPDAGVRYFCLTERIPDLLEKVPQCKADLPEEGVSMQKKDVFPGLDILGIHDIDSFFNQMRPTPIEAE